MIRTPLPQLVPSHVCFQCDVCCRFPEADSFLRPYFTEAEIRQAVAAGVDPGHFSDHGGGQVSLVPNPNGEGYVCPAFEVATARCRIYDMRPLDCQIYPLAVMWNAEHAQVVLGWDTKCPFLRSGTDYEVRRNEIEQSPPPSNPATTHPEPPESLKAYADRVATLLEGDESVGVYARHPGLIGRYQDDVVVLRPLPKLTGRLRPSALRPPPSALGLQRLSITDRERFDRVCAAQDTPLAAYAFVYHVVWQHLFTYAWAEVEDHLCLFAEYTDGIFMPLPPLPLHGTGERPVAQGKGWRENEGVIRSHAPRATGLVPNAAVIAAAFDYMRLRNRGAAVSRIENVPEEWVGILEVLGYRVTPKHPDYLYRTEALAHLAGDRFKSQRAACNRFEREHGGACAPYRETDLEACLRLYREWVQQQESQGPAASNPVARAMLEDAALAHGTALAEVKELGLLARVVRVGQTIRAYTLGYPRSSAIYCVLHEVADRTVPGLAQFLFREFCRELDGLGFAWVNTLDDSGLPSLARSKRAYHPERLVGSYIITEGNG